MGALTAALLLVPGPAFGEDVPSVPIPQDPNDVEKVPDFLGRAASPRPLRTFRVPRHPFMAPNDDSNIHNDAYQTDAYRRPGPLGRSMESRSTYHQAECASVTFDRAGRIITICVGVEGPRLLMIDPDTLATKTEMPLPPRSGGGTGSGVFNDFSGGGYFYLDHRSRAVIPTNSRQIWVVDARVVEGDWAFEVDRVYNIAPAMEPNEAIVAVMPDWKGRYWFVTTRGLVGFATRKAGAVKTFRLEDESIANSFAVDRSGGVYVASDHALYRFGVRRREPQVVWRRSYDRGRRVKPGQAGQGSGTTPTIIGRRFVAITDNADPQMHVLVYRRAAKLRARRLVCKQGVFPHRRGATDQSLTAVGHSLIVENNYGYEGPTSTMNGATTTPGFVRVRFGARGCDVIWRNREVAPSVVPKVSLPDGLIYTYTKPRRRDEVDAWYFTAIDFRTGRTVFKKLAGTGLGYNNNYAPVSIGPDGSAYVGALGGLVQLRDA